MRLTVLGWYALFWAVLVVVVAVCCSGCSKRMYESVVRDTVTVVRVDSVLVTMREVGVTLPVPQIVLSERVPLCDTLLVLDNGLYQSAVEIKDGQLTHTLKPSAAADSLHGTVTVADTTHVSHDHTSTVHVEQEKQVTERQPSLWERVERRVGGAAVWLLAVCAAVLAVWLYVRR